MVRQVLSALGLLVFFFAPATAQVFPGEKWEIRTPESADLDRAKLAELVELVGGSGMIVRDGYRVFAWGDVAEPVDWASAGKGLLTTMLFMATGEGRCRLNSTVGEFLGGGSPKDSEITFWHLANMISGYGRAEGPGEAWAYNDFAIQLYGYVLFQLVYGAAPSEVVANRLAFLRFEDEVSISDRQYGRVKGMSIRDYARLGHLWLERGRWGDEQRIPENLFNLITNLVSVDLRRTAENGTTSWTLGSYGGGEDMIDIGPGHYGMNFWVNTNGFWPGGPPRAFQANGHDGGKACFVIPELDLVAVGVGSWGHPSTHVLRLLVEADRRSPKQTWVSSATAEFSMR